MSDDAHFPCRVTTMIILIFSCFILQAVTVTGFRFLSIPHNDFYSNINEKNPHIITDEYTLVSPGSVYGLCNDNPHNKSEDYCIFYMEKSSNVNSTEHLRKCQFTFNNCKEPKCLFLFLLRDIVAIDKDKAVLITHELLSNDGIIEILDFSDCKVTPVPINKDVIRGEIDMKESIVGAPTYDTFDVYLKTEDQLPTKGRYQGIIDFHGNTITLTDAMNIPQYIKDSNVVMHSPLKGRFVVWATQNYIIIDRYDYDGSSKFVESYPLGGSGDGIDDENYAASITNQLLTACGRYHQEITCGQFDNNGNLKFETRVHVPDSLVIYYLKTFNLRGGGFLLLIVHCTDKPKESYRYCKNPGQDVVVKKIDATGAYLGSLTIDQFPIKVKSQFYDNSQFHFFENEEEGEMCLSLLDWNLKTVDDKVALNIACFKDEDFHS